MRITQLMGAAHTTKRTQKMESSDTNTREVTERQVSRASSSTRPLSIQGPSSTNDSNEMLEMLPNQPRQPTDLQGVLRFAMDATERQDLSHGNQFHPMDEERKEFLKQTLSCLTGSVIEELRTSIKVLSDVVDLGPHDDTSHHEDALERITDYVDNIDIANDFYKIRGFSIFGPCLNSPHSSIRWRTADVIAELSQNNPFCQERFLETGLFPMLLNMIDSDPAEAARIKALYAVSCIVRGHPISMKYMDVNDGYSVLLRAMQSSIKKLQIKSAFLLSSLCNKENTDELKLTLVNMGLVEQAAGLLASDELLPEIRDQLLNILDGLTNRDSLPTFKECRRPELGLRPTLERCVRDLKEEESLDQVDVCHRLMDRIFADHETVQER